MRNQKGMALVSLLAFLALAMILFSGMVYSYQSASARDQGEFEDQQVLLMAQSHMELAKNQLSNREVFEALIDEQRVTMVASTVRDIENQVDAQLGSKNCVSDAKQEVCTYPVKLTSTSSMRGVERTVSANTKIVRKTVFNTTIPENVIKAIEKVLTIEEVNGGKGEKLTVFNDNSSIITNKDDKKIFVEIKGPVLNTDLDEFAVGVKDDDYMKLPECSGDRTQYIEESCIFSNDKTIDSAYLIVAPQENEIITIAIKGDLKLTDGFIINSGANNSAVVLVILSDGELIFEDARFVYDEKKGDKITQSLILSDSSSDNVFTLENKKATTGTIEPSVEGLIYLPNGKIDLDNGKGNKTVKGSIVTRGFNYQSSQNNTLIIEKGIIDLSMFCVDGGYCPFVKEGDSGEGAESVSYTLGEFKYVK